MKDVLRLAESFELEGYRFYHLKAKEAKTKPVASIFEYLAEMEKEHTEFIRRLIKELKEGGEIAQVPEGMNRTFEWRYESQAMDEVSPEDDILDLSALRMAYLVEKDFMNFYARAAEVEKDEKLRTILTVLRDWEDGHRRIIEERMREIIDRNHLDLGFYPF